MQNADAGCGPIVHRPCQCSTWPPRLVADGSPAAPCKSPAASVLNHVGAKQPMVCLADRRLYTRVTDHARHTQLAIGTHDARIDLSCRGCCARRATAHPRLPRSVSDSSAALSWQHLDRTFPRGARCRGMQGPWLSILCNKPSTPLTQYHLALHIEKRCFPSGTLATFRPPARLAADMAVDAEQVALGHHLGVEEVLSSVAALEWLCTRPPTLLSGRRGGLPCWPCTW